MIRTKIKMTIKDNEILNKIAEEYQDRRNVVLSARDILHGIFDWASPDRISQIADSIQKAMVAHSKLDVENPQREDCSLLVPHLEDKKWLLTL